MKRHLLILGFLIWGLALPPAYAVFNVKSRTAEQEADDEFERETLQGAAAVNENPIGSLSMKARFDVAFSGGEPTQQGFTTPHFYLGVEGLASQWMSYRLTVSPAREYSSALLPHLVPTEAFFRITNVPISETRDKASIALNFGLFSPDINPLWTPDIGELWIPDFFVGQRQLYLSREIGLQVTATPLPDRWTISAGYFNGNGVFGFNTNNSRAITGYTKFVVPIGGWRFFVGGGAFQFTQGTPGTTNYRSHLVANPFIGVDYEPLTMNVSLEGWLGNYEDVALRRHPRGFVVSARAGHPRVQGFVRYFNLSAAPTSSGYLSELHTGLATDPFPHLKMFLYFAQLKGRAASAENSVNLRARFAF